MERDSFKISSKLICKFLLVFGLFFFVPQQAEAQFFKKLAKKAKQKIDREAEKRAERRVNKKIDKEFDKAEDALDGKKKNKKKKDDAKKSKGKNVENEQVEKGSEIKKPNVVWSKFDFVPGDTVIFEDGPGVNEENGEFPSRWDLHEGSAEIGEIGGKPIIMFLNSGGAIVPYLKNSKEDYLPEIFTIEFDVWFDKGQTTSNRYFISFKDQKNQWKKGFNDRLTVTPTGLEFGKTDKRYPGTENLGWSEEPIGKWRHISIAFTKGKFKAYMDDTRLINVPHLEGNPYGLTIEALAENMYLRNIRIAKGGVKYYDRVISEGKIIVNGIKFDVNKATLKPESTGPINKIYQLMHKNPDINFSVEGHTDSDGNDANNQTLSEARGKSVMNKLIEIGISENRLKSNGFGESKPIDNNTTAEGKANNRRVEFVKFTGKSSSNNSNTSTSSNSGFDKLDRKSIADKLESLPDNNNIPIANKSGIVNGKGTIILFATSDGNMGKMEILDIDKYDNYKMTIKYVTYNYNGDIHSKSNDLKVIGTYLCDLDGGNAEDASRNDSDFWYKGADKNTAIIYPSETSILKIYKN